MLSKKSIQLRSQITQISNSLTDFIGCTAQKRSGHSIVKIENGDAFFFNLLNNDKIAVSNSFATKGSAFPCHSHEQTELIVVYDGKIEITFPKDKKKYIFGPKEFIYIQANQEHRGVILENTWMIAITMPPSPDWPTGEL